MKEQQSRLQEEEMQVLPWATDYPRSVKREMAGAVYEFVVPSELLNELRQFAVQQGVLLSDVWMAAWAILISRYTRVEQVSLGTLHEQGHGVDVCLVELLNTMSFRQVVQNIHDREPRAGLHPQTLCLWDVQQESGLPDGCELSLRVLDHLLEGRGQLLYRSDLFATQTIKRMSRNLLVLLQGVMDSSDTLISKLPIVHAEELERLQQFHGETRDYPTHRCFPELFVEQALKTPERVALRYKQAEMTYRELNERANVLGRHLQEMGVTRNAFVGYFGERNLDWVVAILAIWKAGGVYVPLDPAYPADRLGYMMEDTGMNVILTAKAFVNGLPSTESQVFLLDEEWATCSADAKENVTSSCISTDVAYVIYTSGSTGRPKGAMVEHRGMINHLCCKVDELHLHADDRLAQNSSQCVDISIWQLFAGLLVGACVHILPDDVAFDPYRQVEAMEAQHLTVVETVPTLLRSMLDELKHFDPQPSLSALRWMIPNGEALPPELCRRWLAAYPHVPLINAYGPTECSDDVTHFFIHEPPADTVVTTLIGRALPNVRLYVLDAHLQPVPIGVMGELYVGGQVVGRGYLNNSEKTRAAFLQDPFSAEVGARLYRTGDYARYLDDGNLDFMGRVDHQVKVNGMRIELGEIEAALTDHSDIEHCLVVDRVDEQERKHLVAYMVCQLGSNPSAQELRAFLSKTLPKHMVPSTFVQLPEFPLTLNGKIDRKRLPDPIFEEFSSTEEYVMPVTEDERKMTRIWQEVLGVECVGLHDRFFDLGGHSLQAIQVLSIVRREFAKEVSLRDLFEHSTPAGLLSVLKTGGGSGVPELVPLVHDRPVQATFIQQRLWNQQKANPMPVLYNVPISLRFQGHLQVEALRLALQEMMRRHDSLRTVFLEQEGVPYQTVLPELELPWKTEDLSMLAETELHEQVRVRDLEEASVAFDLVHGPLLSTRLLKLGEREHHLIISMHHLISDGWSVRVIREELSDLYRHFAHGMERKRPALGLQYLDFAKWHGDWLAEEGMTEQLAYWQEQLGGAYPMLPLPVDRETGTSYLGKTLGLRLPDTLVAQLTELSQQAGCTLFMTMLAGYLVLLHHYSGQEDIAIGVPSTNRNHPDLEAMIGLIVNLLVIRTDLSGQPSFRELLRRVQSGSVGAFANQDYPIDLLFEKVQPELKQNGGRLFQTMFAYENNRTDGSEFAPGLTVEVKEIRSEMARGNMILSVVEEDTGLDILFEYKSDLFDESSIQRMLREMQSILEGAVRDLDQRIDQLVKK